MANSQTATIFPSIFWGVMTLFRFVMAFIPSSSSKKLRFLLECNLATGIISMILIKTGYALVGCYFSAAMFGFSMSVIYPLVFTLPIEGGLRLEESQTTNISMGGVVAEGLITMVVGILMEKIGIDTLFYTIILLVIIMYIDRLVCLYLIKQQLEES